MAMLQHSESLTWLKRLAALGTWMTSRATDGFILDDVTCHRWFHLG
jgi:hypothetical protein